MLRKFAGLFSLIVAVSVFASTADARKYRINTRGWSGGSYQSKTTGRFSHCVVSSKYKRGDWLLLSINRNYKFSVSILDRDFNLRKGASYRAIMHVDYGREFTRRAKVIANDLVTIPVDDRVTFFRLVKRGRILRIFIDGLGLERGYSLKGTTRALNATLRCVRNSLRDENYNRPDLEVVPGGNETSASNKPDAVPENGSGGDTGRPPKNRVASLPPSGNGAANNSISGQKSLIYSINLLSSAGLSGYTILENNPFKSSGYTASWRYSKGKFGAFAGFRNTPANFLDTQTAKILGDDARDCKGQFASGFRQSEKNGKWSGRRLFTVCSNSTNNNDFTINYSIGRQANGTATIVATVVSGSAPANSASEGEEIDKAIYESSAFRKIGR